MLEDLKQKVYEANMLLYKHNLVIFTWGNVSGKSDDGKYIAIKPSGVAYEILKPQDIVILDTEGNIVEGNLNPSSDTPTHIELYRAFPKVKGICHTHSNYATSFAQAGKTIDAFGTTQADYFYGNIPCTRCLTQEETENDYEKNTGKVIAQTFSNLDYMAIPGVLVKQHGVFTWGNTAYNAVHHAIVMEELAKMNYQTIQLNSGDNKLPQYTLNKHYNRKHGKNAYYGQKQGV